MSEKRRDNRNRILHEGEYQRADGRYRFRYVDIHGNEGNLYSWRLDHNDPIPKGKKMELSLREKEKQLEQDMFNGLVLGGGGLTVLELVEKYVSLKIGVRQSTYASYKTVINLLKKDDFGKKRIDKVKLSDAKAWLIKLQRVDGKGYSSIHTIRGVLRPAFQMAEEDDLIRKNPFGFEPMVDGMTGFLFLDKNDMPMVALHWEKYFQHIREKYNSIYKVQMPPITPHVCRHTFCSNMAKSGMNPKMLQYIMGHSDISVTMNTYTHVKFQDAQEDFQKAINS